MGGLESDAPLPEQPGHIGQGAQRADEGFRAGDRGELRLPPVRPGRVEVAHLWVGRKGNIGVDDDDVSALGQAGHGLGGALPVGLLVGEGVPEREADGDVGRRQVRADLADTLVLEAQEPDARPGGHRLIADGALPVGIEQGRQRPGRQDVESAEGETGRRRLANPGFCGREPGRTVVTRRLLDPPPVQPQKVRLGPERGHVEIAAGDRLVPAAEGPAGDRDQPALVHLVALAPPADEGQPVEHLDPEVSEPGAHQDRAVPLRRQGQSGVGRQDVVRGGSLDGRPHVAPEDGAGRRQRPGRAKRQSKAVQ